MVSKDKSYRFRLASELFEAALQKAGREDLSLAQVLRRLLRAWIAGQIELPPYVEIEGESQEQE